jgi:hypothetical protein
MKGRSKSVHLVVDGLPAHKKAKVRQYIESTNGKLNMQILRVNARPFEFCALTTP